jgi:hypothetical protein
MTGGLLAALIAELLGRSGEDVGRAGRAGSRTPVQARVKTLRSGS